MSLADVDWSVLRGTIVVLVVSLTISGSLVYGGYSVASDAELQHLRAKGRFQAARARYLTLDDEKRVIEEFGPRFSELESAGLIGDERRLSWVETLRTVAQGMKMPALQYEIATQEPMTPEFTVPAGTFSVYGTEMRLSMGLLHAGDLPAVFAALGESARGLFTVTGCSLKRQTDELGVQVDPRKPNLKADCRLQWMVTRKPETGT